jgi:hypothetical protein
MSRTLKWAMATAAFALAVGGGVLIGTSLAGPAEPAPAAADDDEPTEHQSALYRYSLAAYDLPDELLDATHRISSVIPLVRVIDDDQLLVVVSSQVFHFSPSFEDGEYEGTGFPTQDEMAGLRAVAAIVQLDGEELRLVDMAELPTASMIRGIEVDGTQLYATNIRDGDGCVTVEVLAFDLTVAPLSVGDPDRLFETEPCLDHEPLGLHMAGGRLVIDDDSILLSLGDLNVSGSFQTETIPEDRPDPLVPPAHYGSVIEISPDGSASIIASGLRNPQGLAFDRAGQLWATDHGPGGGDELNLIRPGADFGWPQVSYGIPYGPPLPQGEWDPQRFGGHHDGFDIPTFAWSPAIAPGELVVYDGAEFSLWEDDLLVSTLRDRSLRRLRFDEGRVVMDERIEVGSRIRDLVIDPDGQIVMTTQAGEIVVMSSAEDR